MSYSMPHVNGAASKFEPEPPILDTEEEQIEMATRTTDTLKLPSWAVGVLITLGLAIFGQLGATLYQAGQWQSNVAHMQSQATEMRAELQEQRRTIEALRLELAETRLNRK